MRATLTCTACGTVLGVPKAGMPADGLPCNWCGYVNVKAPEPAAKPAVTKVAAPSPAPAARPSDLPDWSDDADDSRPYAVPPEEVKARPCAACGKDIDLVAVVCVHCGYNSETGRKVSRIITPIDREWAAGWSLQRRLAVLVAVQVVNAASLGVSLAVGGSLPASITTIGFYFALQAFLLGTFDTLRIRRNRKGQVEITSTWRVAFVPLVPRKVDWKAHEGVAFGHYDATSVVDWVMALILLPMFVLPVVLWWFFVIRSDRFYAALTRDRGFPETYLYRGMNEKQAREIAQVATDVTALRLETPL